MNGKLTGFWSEDNEYNMSEAFNFDFHFGKFSKKIIGLYFYPKGELKSITFWPKDKIIIEAPSGKMLGIIIP
ncbi:MAG TPA: hypothetical protein VIK72_06915 [Clostridiaceae bacterium]